MTLCIAAITYGRGIVGASDSLVTSGDEQGENATKIQILVPTPDKLKKPTVVAFTAGDAALQAEIVEEVQKITFPEFHQNPNKIWPIDEIVELYIQAYEKVKFKRVEFSILRPQGLDLQMWVTRQKELNSQLVSDIKNELSTFMLDGIETIICGIDNAGPHIYTFHNNDYYRPASNPVRCQDLTGFAVIGSGSKHAHSQMLLGGYHRGIDFHEALLLIYMAKKRAERDPFVGPGTDILSVSETGLALYGDEFAPELKLIYEKVKKSEEEALTVAKTEAKAYVEKIQKEQMEKKITPH